MNRDRPRWPPRVGWLTGAAVAAVIVVNVAGIWGIALARRTVVEDAARFLRMETTARARSVESAIAATRSDLVFLTRSPAFFGLKSALDSPDRRQALRRRQGAESILLLFLRGHTEVSHLIVRAAEGARLVETGTRGGVPVVWTSQGAVPEDAPAAGSHGPESPRVAARFDFRTGPPEEPGDLSLEATIDPGSFVARGWGRAERSWGCTLMDERGALLASGPRSGATGGDPVGAPTPGGSPATWLAAEATIQAEGWLAPSPWHLACTQRVERAVALVEPLAARYRLTLVLNLAVMGLALLLGSFAIQQARRREHLEARAREEARVREVERQLFHAERLSTVGRLAAGMAHEINNPLEGMSNYLSLAGEAVDRGDGAAASRHLAGVREGLERAAGVVRQVLAHADPATAPRTPIDLNGVLRQSSEFVRARPEFRAVEFTLDLARGPLSVRGSAVMLGQVFLNLFLNACEAQPQGGEVRVTSRRDRGQAVVEIADRGPGVPSADEERIFEPFYSTKQSTGLGLSICHAIVRQHDGQLFVRAAEAGGAVFTITFPAVEPGRG